MQFHVSSIDLSAEGASGGVIIEDSIVWLRDVSGRSAGGSIKTSGKLDFRSDPVRLQFDLTVYGHWH